MPDFDVASRHTIADWIEATLLVRGAHIGFDALDSLISEELNVSIADIAFAVGVMSRRAELLGAAYPFDIGGVAVAPRAEALERVYSLLLFLSPDNPARQLVYRNPTDGMAQLFERVVVRAMCRMLGRDSKALRFGWPSEEGRPQNFHQAIEWLAGKMGIEAGSAYRPPRRKDGGVDIVAWRPFRDGKSGFPVLLVQCTLQKELVSKSSDVDVRNWSGWLTLDAEPGTVLAVPGTIASTQSWNDIAVRTMILDRIRIVELLNEESVSEIAGATEVIAETVAQLGDRLLGAEK